MIKIRVGRRKSDSIRISLIEGSLKLDDSKLEKKNYNVTTEQLLEQNEVKRFTFGMVQSLLFINKRTKLQALELDLGSRETVSI